MEKDILHVVAGPTACGKTAHAIALAKAVGGEVVSADSMQVYQYMDIGTAKPTVAEMEGVPHHLLDVVTPDQHFTVADYVPLATAAIGDILTRGKVPILAGGTGFYINAILRGTQFTDGNQAEDAQFRETYLALAQTHGVDYVHQKLAALDPTYAAGVHPNNVKKVVRALAFYHTTGTMLSAHNAKEKAALGRYQVQLHVIEKPRDILYENINARVLDMWDRGLPGEVEGLLNRGYHAAMKAMEGIGYKETIGFLEGRMTKDETIALMQQNTRHYAKRQDTWFRHQLGEAKA